MSDVAGAPAHEGCAIPEDLLYDVDADVWLRREGEEAVVGMTDPAQTRCGKIVAITFRPVGKRISRGKPVATIESAKWVGPFPSPVTGVVVASNVEAFRADLLVANRDPYGAGWLARIRMEDPLELERLLPGGEAFLRYRERIDELGLRCVRCADAPLPMMEA